MIDRRSSVFGVALAAVLAAGSAAALQGCSGGQSGSAQESQSRGIFGLFARKDPNADLTPEEGQKLLAEIRKDNRRMQKLTPGERRYLARAAAGSNKD